MLGPWIPGPSSRSRWRSGSSSRSSRITGRTPPCGGCERCRGSDPRATRSSASNSSAPTTRGSSATLRIRPTTASSSPTSWTWPSSTSTRRLEVVYANAAAHALVDRPPGTLLGLDLLEVFLDPQIEALARTALDQGNAAGEVRLRGADGPALLVRARRSTAGGVWLVLADVSELRRLQQIRAEFIDNLSHELRTPLTTVGLLAETLSRDADAAGKAIPPKMRDRIAKIEVETGHLVQMVSEIMDLSRIESGTGLTLVDDLDLGRLATASAERLRLFAERQGVTLRVDVPPGLPHTRGDEARLGQVFVNLLHNAVKFSPSGSEVVIGVRPADRELVASVQDHGIGIPRTAQARIFERFYKVDRARVRGETPGGTGPRPVDRPARRRAARRPDLGRIHRGRGLDLLLRPAPCPGGALTGGSAARRDPEPAQPGRPLGRAPAAPPRRHGGAAARPARSPGMRVSAPAGPAARRGRGRSLPRGSWLGGSAGVRQQHPRPRAPGCL